MGPLPLIDLKQLRRTIFGNAIFIELLFWARIYKLNRKEEWAQ